MEPGTLTGYCRIVFDEAEGRVSVSPYEASSGLLCRNPNGEALLINEARMRFQEVASLVCRAVTCINKGGERATALRRYVPALSLQ